jgi:hypothetical protein
LVRASATHLSLDAIRQGQDRDNVIANHARNMQIVESINFHHDAITGTHYDNVGIGYDKSMLDALKRNSLIESKLIKNLAEISGLKID